MCYQFVLPKLKQQPLPLGAGDHTPIPLYIHVLGGFGFFGVSTCYPLGHENHFLELLFKVCLKVRACRSIKA